MINSLVLYSDNTGCKNAFEKYVKNFNKRPENTNSYYFLLPEFDVVEFNKIIDNYFDGSANIKLNKNNTNGNDLFSFFHSNIAPEIGGQFYGGNDNPDLFILFRPDTIQMYFLKHFQKVANFKIHLFMEEADYKSGNLVVSLKDWIPFMNFEIVEM